MTNNQNILASVLRLERGVNTAKDTQGIDVMITRRDLAVITGSSIPTIIRHGKAGLMPVGVKTGPNSVRYRLSEVQEWMKDPQAWAKKHSEVAA